MLDKFLIEVVSSIVGKLGEDLALIINSKKHVNEFTIAKKMEITINQTRNLLYKLSDHGLVSSIRKKDKKKGWYTYFWKIEILKTLQMLRQGLVERQNKIREISEVRAKKQFYICKRCSLEYNEDDALLMNFTCNECGDIFELKDNEKLVKELNKRVDKFDLDIADVDSEIDKENIRLGKIRQRELNKLAKEKEAKRLEKKAIRDKERAAKRKAMGLPPVKKRVVKTPAQKRADAKKKLEKKKAIEAKKKAIAARKKAAAAKKKIAEAKKKIAAAKKKAIAKKKTTVKKKVVSKKKVLTKKK